MKRFCENVNKDLPKEKKVLCSMPSGCGIDDTCTIDQICIPKTGGDYYCGECCQRWS